MTYKITVEHSFEAAHRLPHLGGKCTSLHGHSWAVAVTVAAPELNRDMTVVEFGALKVGVRRWIDTYLDHGTMLGVQDSLVGPLSADGSKVFRFGVEHADVGTEGFAADLVWPTVEAAAVLLGRVSHSVLAELPRVAGARVERVLVRETRLNTAVYEPAGTP